jgi:hypothetical protein
MQHPVSPTNRNELGAYDYSGGAGTTAAKGQRTYQAEYNQRNNDIKASTIQGYMVQGNMALMNNDINMRQKMLEKDMSNRMAPLATPLNPTTPDSKMLGQMNGQGTSRLYSGISLDRNSPEMLDSLKQNPYTLSVVNGL